jgi:hypothetical protein
MCELSRTEKDMLILAIICTHLSTSETTLRTSQKNVKRKRTRLRELHFENKRMCRETFCFLFDTSRETLNVYKKHYLKNGLVPRELKAGKQDSLLYFILFCIGTIFSSGGRRKTALNLEDVKHVVAFINNFADQQGLVLPGRVAGFPRSAVKVIIIL